jgi:hypothetical protein
MDGDMWRRLRGPAERVRVSTRGEREGNIVIRARMRRLAATVTIGSFLAIQAFAGSATAAVPDALFPSEAIPGTYTAGEAAGFRGFFQLDPTETSTLSKLFLRIDVDETKATNVFYSVKRNGAAVPAKACKLEAQDVVCELKTFRPGELVVATAGYLAAAGETKVDSLYLWSSVGVPQNDDQSHGDSWFTLPALTAVEIDPDDPDFVNYGGGFTYNLDRSVGNSPIGPGNLQSTKLVGLPVGVAATVLDGLAEPPHGTCETTAEIDCDALFGEWVEVTVGDGLTYPEFQIQLTYASGTPKGFVHLFVVGGEVLQEPIDACAKKVADRTLPCFTWKASTNTATIFTLHNGTYKGR